MSVHHVNVIHHVFKYEKRPDPKKGCRYSKQYLRRLKVSTSKTVILEAAG